MLGYGMTGEVNEFVYKGKSVALKRGEPFDDRWQKEDGYAHIESEIEVYDDLKKYTGEGRAESSSRWLLRTLYPWLYCARNGESGKDCRGKRKKVVCRWRRVGPVGYAYAEGEGRGRTGTDPHL